MAPGVVGADAWRAPVAERKSNISLKADLVTQGGQLPSLPTTTLFTKGFMLIR